MFIGWLCWKSESWDPPVLAPLGDGRLCFFFIPLVLVSDQVESREWRDQAGTGRLHVGLAMLEHLVLGLGGTGSVGHVAAFKTADVFPILEVGTAVVYSGQTGLGKPVIKKSIG